MHEPADFENANQNTIFVIALITLKFIDLKTTRKIDFFEAMKSLHSEKNKNLLKKTVDNI